MSILVTALPDTTTFTVVTDNGVTQLVIGYSTVNTNRVTIPVTTSEYYSLDRTSFNAEYFSNILVANKECQSATLQVSSEGLAKINFKIYDKKWI